MSRFGIYCKKCRCFRENISSPEVKAIMDRRENSCFAGEDVYASGECKFFLDIEEPLDNLVREIGQSLAKMREPSQAVNHAKAQGGSPKP